MGVSLCRSLLICVVNGIQNQFIQAQTCMIDSVYAPSRVHCTYRYNALLHQLNCTFKHAPYTSYCISQTPCSDMEVHQLHIIASARPQSKLSEFITHKCYSSETSYTYTILNICYHAVRWCCAVVKMGIIQT